MILMLVIWPNWLLCVQVSMIPDVQERGDTGFRML